MISQRLLTLLIYSFVFLLSCKPINDSGLHSSGEYQYSLGLMQQIPTDLVLFLEVIRGDQKSMNDHYFTSILPKALPAHTKMSAEVSFPVIENGWTKYEVYRGITSGTRVLVFKKEDFGKNNYTTDINENGIRWYPFKSYPLSILGDNKTLEEKIKYCVHAEVYEKKAIGMRQAAANALEFAAHFIPGYGGVSTVVNEGKAYGWVWAVGDIASLGMAAKVNAVAQTSRVIVVGTATVRLGNAAVNASQGTMTWVDGVDAVLASVEGGFAIAGFARLVYRNAAGKAYQTFDDLLIEANQNGTRFFVKDEASAKLIAPHLIREADGATGSTVKYVDMVEDILKNGITPADVAKVSGRKLPNFSNIDQLIAAGKVKPRSIDMNRVQTSLKKIDDGIPLSEVEALELAASSLYSKADGKLFFNATASIQKMWVSKSIWGAAEEMATYASKTPVSWSWLKSGITMGKSFFEKRKGLIIFQGEAAKLFQIHPTRGIMSIIKKVNGEYVTGMGDLIIEKAVRSGDSIIITKARLASSGDRVIVKGQSMTLAEAKRKRFNQTMVFEVAMGGVLSAAPITLGIGIVKDIMNGDSQFDTSSETPLEIDLSLISSNEEVSAVKIDI